MVLGRKIAYRLIHREVELFGRITEIWRCGLDGLRVALLEEVYHYS